MSERNLELHRGIVAAYNARDLEALIARVDPRVDLHPVFAAAGGAVYHGHDGARSWYQDQLDAFGDELHIEPEAFFDLGDQTLLFYVFQGRGRQSGANVAMSLAQVCTWRDGLCVYSKMYANRQDALEDLGVTEDVLKPIAP